MVFVLVKTNKLLKYCVCHLVHCAADLRKNKSAFGKYRRNLKLVFHSAKGLNALLSKL